SSDLLLLELGGELLELSGELALGFLKPFRFRDVAGDLGGADDPAGLVAYRRDAERDVETSAVFVEADRLVVVDSVAPHEPADDVSFFVMALRRDQDVDRLPDRLLGRPAEDPRRAGIPASNDAVERLADDGIVGRV